MVDELQVWPHAKGIFRKGSCHLTATTLDELHAFAARIGMRRAWFQDHPILAHYDLTPARRADALHLGAEVVPMRAQLRARRARIEAEKRGPVPRDAG